jgi:hypothetical protein
MTTLTTEFDVKIHDIVRLANGHQFIITGINPKRPVNLFSGVLVNGQGAEYKFGAKHRPVVIGHAPANHPALISLNVRKGTAGPSQDTIAIVFHLLDAVEADDLSKAKILAAVLRTTEQFRKS